MHKNKNAYKTISEAAKEIDLPDLETILIIFKQPRWVHEFVTSKFSRNYKVEYIFISNLIKKNNKEIIKLINTTIENKKISIALFEGDHISIINFDFINSIKVKKKGCFFLMILCIMK